MNIKEIQNQNPWWSDKNYFCDEAEFVKRDLFLELKKDLSSYFITSILGLRRVGKSTLMKQLISSLLEEKKRHHIFYYFFDQHSQIKTTSFLDELLEFYIEKILKEKIYQLKEKVYIFLDEIQYINNWEDVIKKYYDLSNKKIKFIVSGSQSILIQNRNKESLAGRIFEYYLPPLNFQEFLKIKKSTLVLEKLDIKKVGEDFWHWNEVDFEIGHEIENLTYEYILHGQFPECLFIDSIEKKNEYILESVLGKILEDIIRIKGIDRQEEFKASCFHFLNNISSIFELKNIGEIVGVSFITMEKYLSHLINGYIVEKFYKKNKSIIKKGRSQKKIYATSTNFTCALNDYNQRSFLEVPDVFGKILENLIYNVLCQKYTDLYFWRKREKEVDFIVDGLAVEVKFKNQIDRQDLRNIIFYAERNNLETVILITKNQLEEREVRGIKIYLIPFYLLLG